jgi:hypothetical protein
MWDSMEEVFILIVVLGSSAATYVWTRQRISDSVALRIAVHAVLECLGAATMFFVVNTAVGFALVLTVRGLTPSFVSVYVLKPIMLVALSLLQGLIFTLWWREQ